MLPSGLAASFLLSAGVASRLYVGWQHLPDSASDFASDWHCDVKYYDFCRGWRKVVVRCPKALLTCYRKGFNLVIRARLVAVRHKEKPP